MGGESPDWQGGLAEALCWYEGQDYVGSDPVWVTQARNWLRRDAPHKPVITKSDPYRDCQQWYCRVEFDGHAAYIAVADTAANAMTKAQRIIDTLLRNKL
jgi:hypothetical protein